MKFFLSKALIAALVIITVAILVLWNYPFNVNKYKGITLGMDAPEKGGDHMVWAPPDDSVPSSSFYVYVLGDESMCFGSMCGMGGYFTECLNGWLSGVMQLPTQEDYLGLDIAKVESGEMSIVIVSDVVGKVVGIYPGARVRNVPFILRNHHDLIDAERWRMCSGILPRWWK
ncbi:MAG: hypothetical protein A2538_00790 [Candidatus Magasanikbacteria bacterium RIFOXYD2_FULL_41_14]|uniref:Uncharacterized protein n=1 Tax=Candidatus Magasanikbacteria bacterium RIFOXYD2_FULL_41_14 TaxID=1798709 RepID=A0A1F6PE48_9BACT|nr:MAG: hypothetical protein A2538_00790 [Candidatus Magasanikbacteria bacterium RIFOXYD2_FULL_41_14]